MDFKISRGQDITIVEVKLTTNDQYLHGFEVQIEEYGKAEQTDKLVYVLVDLGHPRKVQKVCDLRDRKVDGSFFIWLFLPACVIIWKSIIFPACLILRRCQPHPLFCYIQENLNAFNSLLTAERLAEARAMSIFEYDQERHMQQEREAGIEKGRRQGEEQLLCRLVKKNLSRGMSISEIAEVLDETEERIREIAASETGEQKEA